MHNSTEVTVANSLSPSGTHILRLFQHLTICILHLSGRYEYNIMKMRFTNKKFYDNVSKYFAQKRNYRQRK